MTESHASPGSPESPAQDSPAPPDAAAPTALARAFARTPLLGPAVVALTFVAMAGYSWGRWLDPLIDFGRELYVPWQLTEGRALYTELAYFNGPLSPYWNALLFAIFGVGLKTLVWANLTILAGVTALLYRFVAAIGGALAATTGAVVFLTHSCFGQKIWVANFNWICPYSHEMTHGFALTMLALAAWSRWTRTRGRGALIGAGVALGLCFLTKPELVLAAGLALAAAFAATWWQDRDARATALRDTAIVATSALVPIVVAFVLLATQMDSGTALRGTLGGWIHVFNADLRGLKYYQWCLGTNDTARSLTLIGTISLTLLAVFGAPLLLLATARDRLRGAGAWLAIAPSLVAVGWATWAVFTTVPLEYPDGATGFQNAYRPLTLVAVVVAGLALVAVLRRRGDAQRTRLVLVLATLAVALLLKMFWHARVHHYGFTLAVPALLLTVVLGVDTLPAFLARRRANAAPLQALALAVLGLSIAFQLRTDDYWYARRTITVGSGADAFYGAAGARGEAVAMLLDRLDEFVEPGASLLVIPEGVTLNYLTRRPNPTRHFNFMPPEFAMFGEDQMLADLQAAPPRYVIVAERRTIEYGVPQFGRDYARRIMRWIVDGYTPVWKLGAEPLHPDRLADRLFGIYVLERRK